ncbi:MAG: indole-3-glycerol-phosphate synthase [Methanosphaera sp.]|nr:indole-3-glycerol-phosphate synthase [Methanosphaera sp.]
MSVIPSIVENKKKTLQISKTKYPLNDLKADAQDYVSTKKKVYRFQEELKKPYVNLIAEYKPASPSQGDISSMSVNDVISIYDDNPVDMISVLTEESYFKSNLENLIKANEYTNKPLLRKDFVIDEYMIYEATLNNSSCVLLMSGICPDIEEYLNISYDLGIDAIVECHTYEDLNNALEYDPMIIGINNRNFNDLTVDLDTTKNLAEYVPNYMISESGVTSIDDAKKLVSYGADGLLIGTSILKDKEADEINKFIKELSNILKK